VIRLLHWAPGSQQATDEDPRDLGRVRRTGWVWLDLSGDDAETLPEYAESFGLEPHHVEDALSDSRFSVLEETPGYLFTILFGYRTGTGLRLDTTRLTVLVGDDFMITVSRDDMPAVRWLHQQITEGASLPNASPIELLASLALAGTRRVLPFIQELEEQIDLLEELAIDADPRTITQAYALRRDVILLRRSLVPQRTVYEDLSSARHRIVDDTVAVDFWRVAHQQAQALELLRAAQTLLESVLEIHRGAVADQTNEIVRVLTVFSAVMLPLGLIAGMWGMNFINLPAAEEPWGFWILVGAMALLAIGLWLYFARRGFVGAPRLRDLPKAAGLGLIQVGVAPIKVVAGGVESTMRFVGLRESPSDLD
jgi:magnesium transporter